MTTPPTEGAGAPAADASAWSDRAPTVSLNKASLNEASLNEASLNEVEPSDQAAAPAAAAFDPYRFGAPEYPVPPEYAPPGYVAPAVQAPLGWATPPGYTAPPGYSAPPGHFGSAVQAPPSTVGQPYQNPQQHLYPSQPDPWHAPNGHQYSQPRPGNGKAVAALILGILSIVLCVLSFLDVFLIFPAIIFGSLALNDAKRSGGGRGMAVSGLVCAGIGALLAIMLTVWLAPKVARCANDYPPNSAAYDTCIRNIVS
jgi:Domain of unknown function (DUF4190)